MRRQTRLPMRRQLRFPRAVGVHLEKFARSGLYDRDPVGPRRSDWVLASLVVLGSFVVLAGTAPHMPIVWDEGDYLVRTDRMIAWFHLLADFRNAQGGVNALSEPVVAQYWWFTTWSEGHPAWFAIPIAI